MLKSPFLLATGLQMAWLHCYLLFIFQSNIFFIRLTYMHMLSLAVSSLHMKTNFGTTLGSTIYKSNHHGQMH